MCRWYSSNINSLRVRLAIVTSLETMQGGGGVFFTSVLGLC